MSRFYGDLEGAAKTVATRRGHTNSGVRSHVRGWNVGIETSVGPQYDDGLASEDGVKVSRDMLTVLVTGGSNGARQAVNLAEVTEDEQGAVRVSLLSIDGGRDVFYILRDGTRCTRLPSQVTSPDVGLVYADHYETRKAELDAEDNAEDEERKQLLKRAEIQANLMRNAEDVARAVGPGGGEYANLDTQPD